MHDWIVSNKMQLNFQSDVVLCIFVFHPEVVVNDTVLEVVDTQLYFGLIFDSIGCHGRVNFLMCTRRCLIILISSNIFSVMS